MSRAHCRGFSLVELMVAMTISLILLGGVLAVTYSSKVTYRENERVARLQENGRAAVELMLRDMRAGGFHGCTKTVPFTNNLTGAGTLLWDFASPVQGYEYVSAGTWSPATDAAIVSPRDGSDIVAVRTVRSDMPSFVTNAAMGSTTGTISVDKDVADSLPAGTAVMISDCVAATVFGVSAFTDAGATATVAHAAGGPVAGVGPGNASNDVGVRFQVGAQIVPVDTVLYYIRDSATVRGAVRNPSLWRQVGDGAAQEIIEGIDALQILYGEDTDGDRIVDSYVAASAVSSWDNVISITLALLIRSVEPNSTDVDSRVYTLLPGSTFGPFNDRYQRTMYTTTVALRNNTT
ncbi:MAG: PilW family protein [Gammaproteobacteria bacterium]